MIPDSNITTVEVENAVISSLGEIDMVTGVNALSLDDEDILDFDHPQSPVIYVRAEPELDRQSAGPDPAYDIRWDVEVLVMIAIRTLVRESMRGSNGCMALAELIRNKLTRSVSRKEFKVDGKFSLSPPAYQKTLYRVLEKSGTRSQQKSWLLAVVPFQTTTTWTGGHVVASGAGVSFPLTPDEGDQFYRTDLDRAFRYNGAKWLSEHRDTYEAISAAGGADGTEIAGHDIAGTRPQYERPQTLVGFALQQQGAGVDPYDIKIAQGATLTTISHATPGSPLRNDLLDIDIGDVLGSGDVVITLESQGATKPTDVVLTLFTRQREA